ncbi:MAG: SDR family NAD(P)-dependent oxidoreductase [Oscillospiraceae bacterium]
MGKATALITGSYGGFGKCLVNIHAENGGDVILVGRSPEKLEAQAREVAEKYNVKAYNIAADLSLPDSAQMIYDECRKNGWEIDYLINNAGFGGQGEFIERTMEQDLSMIAVNVETPTRLCKLFLPDFVKRGSGRVLNVSSTAAIMPGPLQACYYATKAYVTSWSNALWRELKDTGVTVTCLMPGAMTTGFAKAGGLSDTALFDNTVDPMPVARKGYEAMLKGKLNVMSGLIGLQNVMMRMVPVSPKKIMMDFVYNMQKKGSSKK